MKKNIIIISIAILFGSTNGLAQSKATQSANQTKKDLMNNKFYDYIVGKKNGNMSSSNSSEAKWYDSKTGTMKKSSVDEIYKQIKEEADKMWTDANNNHNARKSNKENIKNNTLNKQPYHNDNALYTHPSNNHKTSSISLQPNTEEMENFKTSNKQLIRGMKGISFNNKLKLKGTESYSITNKDDQSYNSATYFTHDKQLIKGMSSNSNLKLTNEKSHSATDNKNYRQPQYTKANTTSKLYYAENGDIYFGYPFESLPEERKKQLLLKERQKSMVSYSTEYKQPTILEALNSTFIAPIHDVGVEICGYISMTPQEIWTELKDAIDSKFMEDFYEETQVRAKKMPLKESIKYVSGKIKEVIASTGKTGNVILNSYESYKRAKDIESTNKGILTKTFSALCNADIDDLQSLSNKLPNEISKDVYKLARRNVTGMPNIPVDKDDIQSTTANLFIKKGPHLIIEKSISK